MKTPVVGELELEVLSIHIYRNQYRFQCVYVLLAHIYFLAHSTEWPASQVADNLGITVTSTSDSDSLQHNTCILLEVTK